MAVLNLTLGLKKMKDFDPKHVSDLIVEYTKNMHLFQLQTEVKEWSERNFPNNKVHQPLLGALEELGELAHAHLKQEQGIRGDQHAAKADAVGDIIIYLADYCARNELCLAECVRTAWEEVKERDWIKFPVNGKNK